MKKNLSGIIKLGVELSREIDGSSFRVLIEALNDMYLLEEMRGNKEKEAFEEVRKLLNDEEWGTFKEMCRICYLGDVYKLERV